jgi:hypothetical protein
MDHRKPQSRSFADTLGGEERFGRFRKRFIAHALTVLAFVKDSYPPLNSFMASLTGHHWRTHGLVDVAVFIVLGLLFTARGIPARGLTGGSVVTVTAATVLAGATLGLWFLFV